MKPGKTVTGKTGMPFFALGVLGPFLGPGCCPQLDCAGTNTLVIQDSSGVVLKDGGGVIVDSRSEPSPCERSESCSYRVSGGATLTISYAGHKTVTLKVDGVKDDCGNYVDQTVTVKLVSESSTEITTPKHVQGSGCG